MQLIASMYKTMYKMAVLVFKTDVYTFLRGLELNCDTNIQVLYNEVV